VSTRAALGIWTLALACAAGAAVMVEASDHTSGKLGTLILAIPTALAFIAGGILARVQRPENRTGTLLILVGFAWTLGALTTSDNDVVFTIGLLVGTLFTALLAHLLLAFPTGRLETRADRVIAYAFYAVAIAGPPLAFLFDEGDLAENPCAGDSPCPDNLIATFPNQTVANAILIAYALASTILAGAVLVRLVQRWRRASPALRRALFPVFVTAAVLIALAVIQSIVGLLISERVGDLMNWFVLAAVLAVPISFLYGLTRTRFGTTTRRLVAELSQKRDPAQVQDVLRAALHDPTLELGYLGPTGYVDVHGRPLQLPEEGGDRMTTRVGDELLVHDAALADQPELEAVVDATHIALERGLSLRSLEASERRATALLDAIPDSMYRVSRDGTFLEFRLSETARLPVPADQLVGMTIADVIGPEAVVEVSAAMARALDHGTTELVEYTLDQPELRDDEPVRHIEARIVRSGPDEVVAIVRDITERKRQQDALEALAAEQAALSRVAVAVATASRPDVLFNVVTEEVALRLGADAANLIRFERNDPEGVVVGTWSNAEAEIAPIGTRFQLNGGPVTRVRETAQPARGHIDDPEIVPSPIVDTLRAQGVRWMVSAPIVVSGDLWGAVVVTTTGDRTFPRDAEERIGQFAGLVAVALANAEAREQLSGLADEQAAVSRVALAIATQSTPETTFDVVTEELGRLLGADAANLVRFQPDSIEGVIVGKWSEPGVAIGMTGRTVVMDGGPLTRVHRTGAAARGHPDDPDISERLRKRLRMLGVTSVVAVPVKVGGEPWGSLVVSLTGDTAFPEGVENRIEQFAGLVAVALANAQARGEIETLAREQAAVSRVAVAAATQPPELLFDVVTEETAKLFGAERGSMVRYVEDDEFEVVGIWQADGAHERKIGERSKLLGGAVTHVKQTGRPSRLDHDYDHDGTARQMVAAPIVVAGELWGAASISSPLPHTFERGVEERLETFTGLVAVALANAQAHRSLATLAEEQSALSRVAVEVATEEQPERLFDIVSEEVGRLLDARSAATVRYVDGEDASVIVGGWSADERFDVDVGALLPFQGGAIERVARTGKPARADIEQQRSTVQQTMRSTDVASHIAAPIVVSGRLWGATSVSIGPPERFPAGSEERLGKFTGLVALALANAEARKQLTASRARIVQAGDAARRRFERNLHDGAQQRLVTLSLSLRLAQAKLHDDPAAAQALLESSSEELAAALEELRELARGLHPAVLTDRGLEAALEALADRAPVPVVLDHVAEGRLPPPVEAAAYYVVAESLTNVAKYAGASSARVRVEQQNGYAIVEVEDDGVGGVDITRGSGLRGLADRVEALDGRLIVSSEAGHGTRVRAEIPCSRQF
jgi:PAS domain S-box-containing protein